MFPCRTCKESISGEAAHCPKCGCKYPTHSSYLAGKIRWIGIDIVAVFVGSGIVYATFLEEPAIVWMIGAQLAVLGALDLLYRVIALVWISSFGSWEASAAR